MAVARKKRVVRKRKPDPVFARRIDECRKLMRTKKLGGYLLTNRMDCYYLTGFTGEDSAIFLTPRDVWVISDSRFATSIKQETPWAKVSLRKGLLEREICTVLKKSRVRKVGVQTDYMTVDMRKEIGKGLKGISLVSAGPVINGLRLLKDAKEVAVLIKAVRIAEDAFRGLCKRIRVGHTEKQLAAQLEFELRTRGATASSFPHIVAEGPNAALPHAFPGQRKVKRGSALLFDWGAEYEFYRSDLTRCVFKGSIPSKIGEIYHICLEAQEAAIEALRPGERMCDVDEVARGIIRKAGFGKYFGHGLGHGLGLDVHENPRLSWQSKEKLQAGMVVTVEPGIYLPGIGGVRVEDDVLVTKSGCRVLSTLSKDLQSAFI